MKRTAFILVLFLIAAVTMCPSCKTGLKDAPDAETAGNWPDSGMYIHPRLEKVWLTQPVLRVPESVIYDSLREQIFVSNIGENSGESQGKGFISRLDTLGNVLDLKWLEGLNAPKGMGISGQYLYVTDVNRVLMINMAVRLPEKIFEIEGSRSLNDIDVDAGGNVFVSDRGGHTIYRITGDKVSPWTTGDHYVNPNGVYAEADRLLVGVRDSLLAVPFSGGLPSLLVSGTGGIDGVEKVEQDLYLISDWTGNVYLVGPYHEKTKILDTTPLEINAADIEYIPEKRLLLVPTFFDNRIMAYRLNLDE